MVETRFRMNEYAQKTSTLAITWWSILIGIAVSNIFTGMFAESKTQYPVPILYQWGLVFFILKDLSYFHYVYIHNKRLLTPQQNTNWSTIGYRLALFVVPILLALLCSLRPAKAWGFSFILFSLLFVLMLVYWGMDSYDSRQYSHQERTAPVLRFLFVDKLGLLLLDVFAFAVVLVKFGVVPHLCNDWRLAVHWLSFFWFVGVSLAWIWAMCCHAKASIATKCQE
jgi:membrane-associated HD superfamily phosphohydrolase